MTKIGCLFLGLLILILFIIEGLVLMFLWNWLIPLFWINAPVLGLFECIGIIILVSMIGSIIRNALGFKKN